MARADGGCWVSAERCIPCKHEDLSGGFTLVPPLVPEKLFSVCSWELVFGKGQCRLLVDNSLLRAQQRQGCTSKT